MSEDNLEKELEKEEENGEINENLVYLPEAGGVAFMELFTQKGVKINLTARGFDAKGALDNLMDAVIYGMNKYKLSVSLTLPQAPEYTPTINDSTSTTPVYQQVNKPQPVSSSSGTNSYKVSAVFHDTDSKGTHHIKVRCGKWVKYGLYAYEQVIPETVEFTSWDMKIDYAPPPEMAIALVDESGEKPRIRGFRPE